MDDESGGSDQTAVELSRSRLQEEKANKHKKKNQESPRVTHLKVDTLCCCYWCRCSRRRYRCCSQFTGPKSVQSCRLSPPPSTPPYPPSLHTACLFFPPERGSYCGDVSCLKGTRNKDAFHPSAYPPCIRHSLTSHSLPLFLSLLPDSPVSCNPLVCLQPLHPPSFPAAPLPTDPPQPLTHRTPLPPLTFVLACECVCVRACTLATEAQGQVEVVTEMMVVCDAAEMLSRSPKAL